MTDKETDFWIQMFTRGMDAYGDSELRASCFADRCLAELRKRTASVPQPTAQEEAAAIVAELRRRYPWLVLDEDGDLVDDRTFSCLVIGSADGKEWRAYAVPDAHEPISCSSFADACKAVNWLAWDATGKGGDE